MRRWGDLDRRQKLTIVFACSSFIAVNALHSNSVPAPAYTCANKLIGTHAVIAGDELGDSAATIAVNNCKGDIIAAVDRLREIYGPGQIMHGAIVKLP